MNFLWILAAIVAVYVVVDLYARLMAGERRFRVLSFLLKATHRALAERGGVGADALFDAQKKELLALSKDEQDRTKRDLKKEGVELRT